MSTSTQKTNVLKYEYDYFRMYSSTITITLECNHDYWYFHDYFNEYPVSTVKVTSMESGVIHFLLLCQYLVFKLITAIHCPDVIIIINHQMTFSCVE